MHAEYSSPQAVHDSSDGRFIGIIPQREYDRLFPPGRHYLIAPPGIRPSLTRPVPDVPGSVMRELFANGRLTGFKVRSTKKRVTDNRKTLT